MKISRNEKLKFRRKDLSTMVVVVFSSFLILLGIFNFQQVLTSSELSEGETWNGTNAEQVVLNKGESISQDIQIEQQNLADFEVYLNENTPATDLLLTIMTYSKDVVFESSMAISEDGIAKADLGELNSSKGERYIFKITLLESSDIESISMAGLTQSTKMSDVLLNDVSVATGFSYNTYGLNNRLDYLSLALSLCSILLGVAAVISRVCYFNISQIKDVLEFVYSKLARYYIHYILMLILWISFGFISLFKFVDLYYYSEASLLGLLCMSVLGIVNVLFTVLLYIKERKSLGNVFILLAIPLAVLYLVYMIPNNVPDESVHFYKTYLMTSGDIRTGYAMIPNDFFQMLPRNYAEYVNVLKLPTNYNDVTGMLVPSSSFINYLAPMISSLIPKLLHAPIYVVFVCGRIGNIVLFLFVGRHLINKTPYAKSVFLVYMLSPMYLQQIASVSPDAFLHMVMLSFVSYVLFLRFDKKTIENSDLAKISVYFLLVLIGKFAYITLFAILFTLIPILGKDKLKKCLFFILLFTGAFAIFILHNKLLPGIEIEQTENSYLTVMNVKPKEQMQFLLESPLQGMKILVSGTLRNMQYYFDTFFGRHLGWLNIKVNSFSFYSYITILLTTLFVTFNEDKCSSDSTEIKLSLSDKVVYFTTAILSSGLVILAMYLYWSPLRGEQILGVQGRYFLGFWILFFIAFSKRIKIYNKVLSILLYLMLVLVHLGVLFNLLIYFI